jgi:hypothetical protein
MVLSGVETYSAEWIFHVCFDDNPETGGKLHIFRVDRAHNFASEHPENRKYGSHEKNSEKNTGYGFLAYPHELAAKSFSIGAYWDGRQDDHATAKAIAEDHVRSKGYQVLDASFHQDRDQGIDFFAMKGGKKTPIQVKSRRRHQRQYGKIFIQLAERNPDGRFN